jgi:hypothetical protein
MTRDAQEKLPLQLAPAGRVEEPPARRLVRPTAIPRAIPIPDQVLQQQLPFASVAPHVYVHEGARQRLHRRLAAHLGRDVDLVITDNRTRMFSARRSREGWTIRMHHMFLDADDAVVHALARYILEGDGESSRLVDEFIERSAHKVRRVPRRRKPIALDFEGRHHHLGRLLESLNSGYFGGRVDAAITWGRDNRGRRRSSIKLGSYNPELRLIRVHPALDQRWVPGYFVASVVHHEMVHAWLHASEGADVGVRHSPRFKELESRFADAERAGEWQKANLARLLAY